MFSNLQNLSSSFLLNGMDLERSPTPPQKAEFL
jgi:hypothetical protein